LQLLNASTTRYMRLRLTSPSGEESKLPRIGGEGGLLDKARIEGGLECTFGYDTQFGECETVLPPGGRRRAGHDAQTTASGQRGG
jgi:hypothetical protein